MKNKIKEFEKRMNLNTLFLMAVFIMITIFIIRIDTTQPKSNHIEKSSIEDIAVKQMMLEDEITELQQSYENKLVKMYLNLYGIDKNDLMLDCKLQDLFDISYNPNLHLIEGFTKNKVLFEIIANVENTGEDVLNCYTYTTDNDGNLSYTLTNCEVLCE